MAEGLYGSFDILHSTSEGVNPSVSFADSSLYTREPWALPRQYETEKSGSIINVGVDTGKEWSTPNIYYRTHMDDKQ